MLMMPKTISSPLKGDQVRVQRDSPDEGLGPVNGVDDPAVSAVAVDVGILLAEEGVVAELRRHRGTQILLDIPIGLGDR
jgi:hypothetical protein